MADDGGMTAPGCRIAAGRPSQLRRRTCVAVCAVCLLLAARPASAEVAVTVRTVDDGRQTGILTAIDESSLVIITGGSTRRIPLIDLIELRCDADEEQVPHAAASRLFLTTGDALAVDVLRLERDALVCRWPQSEDNLDFRIPLETVTGMVLHPASVVREQRALERQLQQREFTTDVLFLTNGDRLAGVFDGLDQNSCRCETAAGPFEVNRSRVGAVGFNAALLAPVEPVELQLVLHLTDGSWLTCRSVAWRGGADLHALTPGGVEIRVPGPRLRSIACYGPRVTPLSDLEPLEIVMTPYLTRETPPRRDRNAYGGSLVVRGESFARGLGMYSRTTATCPLQETYSKFRAVVGIDDAAEGAGSVIFTVAVDGEQVFDSGLVTGRDDPLHVGPIDLRGAESITLSVDYGTQGDIGDLADWCNPVLIR
jgi:hypothetical protein